MSEQGLLQINNLYKYFGATHAVDGASLTVLPGEILGLVGENGSGKSTILSMVSGMLHPDSGNMTLDGKPYAPHNQAEANACKVTIIAQETNTLAGLTVAENIFLGMEGGFMTHGFRNIRKMNQMAAEALKAAGMNDISPKEDVAAYSMEQRKMVELVKSANIHPRLLMIDETSTALSHVGRDELYKLVRATREAGNSVIFISHDLGEVLSICDRVTVLRDGQVVDTLPSAELDEERLKNLMVGRALSGHYYREDYGGIISDEVVLSVRNLTCKNVNNVSFDLHKGEILGIGGLSDSGMHEIGRAIFGIEYDVTGEIELKNPDVRLGTIKEAIHHNVGYISKNRDTESLFQQADIMDNISVPCAAKLEDKGYLSIRKMKSFAEEQAKLLEIKMRDVNQLVSTLSGGNKQKVAVTKWIARGTEVFIMDSPTRGIDIGVKAVIYNLMVELNRQGKSMIVISEELLELIGCCDRILILSNGKINGEFLRSPDLSEEMLVQKMI